MIHPKDEQLFSILASHLPAAIVLTQTSSIELIYQNQVISELCNSTLQYISSENDDGFFIQNEKQLAEALLRGKIINGECLLARLKDGTDRWIHVHSSPLVRNKEEIGLISFFTDLTAIMQQQNELKEKDHYRNHIIKSVAHDLRASFSGLFLFANCINDNIDEQKLEEASETINLLKDVINGASKTANKLLNWANAANENTKPQKATIHLRQFVKSIIDELKATVQLKQLQIRTDIPQHLYGFFDLDMIACTVRNLLNNAIECSHKGGRIELSVKKNLESIVFSVRDYGSGLDEEQLSHFNFTGEVEERNKRCEEESSLGISLSKSYVDLHGGKLWVESIHGKGCNFIFTIPDKDML